MIPQDSFHFSFFISFHAFSANLFIVDWFYRQKKKSRKPVRHNGRLIHPFIWFDKQKRNCMRQVARPLHRGWEVRSTICSSILFVLRVFFALSFKQSASPRRCMEIIIYGPNAESIFSRRCAKIVSSHRLQNPQKREKREWNREKNGVRCWDWTLNVEWEINTMKKSKSSKFVCKYRANGDAEAEMRFVSNQ